MVAVFPPLPLLQRVLLLRPPLLDIFVPLLEVQALQVPLLVMLLLLPLLRLATLQSQVSLQQALTKCFSTS